MTDVEKLIAEGRKGADDPNWRFCTPACPNGTHAHVFPLVTRLADALEAEHERAEAYLSDPEFDQEFVRVKAERDRYRRAIERVVAVPNEFEWDVPPTAGGILTAALDETKED